MGYLIALEYNTARFHKDTGTPQDHRRPLRNVAQTARSALPPVPVH